MPVTVTAVVPTHDRPELLRSTLASIRAQRDVALEIIVVDDASDPPARTVVAALEDPRIRVTRQEPPRGVVAARNAGIALASGEWVAFCDDDDLWAPDKLRRQLGAAEATSRRWVYTGSVDVDLAGRVIGGGPPATPAHLPRLLERFNAVSGGGSGTIVESALLTDAGGFDPEFQGSHLEDWELWLRLARQELPAWVPAPLVGYRVHGGNASLRVEELVAGMRRLEQRHNVTVDRAAFHRNLAWAARRAGQPRLAARQFARAARHGHLVPLAREVAGAVRTGLAPRLTRRPVPTSPWQREAQGWITDVPAR